MIDAFAGVAIRESKLVLAGIWYFRSDSITVLANDPWSETDLACRCSVCRVEFLDKPCCVWRRDPGIN